MERKVIFSNTALNINKLKKLEKILDNNDNIQGMNIYSSRNIKENKVKISDSQSFNNINELINYINENEIKFLETLDMNIYYKNNNVATLKYEKFDNRWELSFKNQDNNIDSLIYNIELLMKNNLLKMYRQYRSFFVFFIGWFLFVLTLKKELEGLRLWIYNLIFILLFMDMVFVKNVPFREYRFISRKKDDIILSVISYILGVVTPYVINWIMNIL